MLNKCTNELNRGIYTSPTSDLQIRWVEYFKSLTRDGKFFCSNPGVALMSFGKIFIYLCHTPSSCLYKRKTVGRITVYAMNAQVDSLAKSGAILDRIEYLA